MPQPRKGVQVPPNGDITPDEINRIRASVGGKEQAPSTQTQATFVNWRQAMDQLGAPFETEHIPISKLYAMRRDPMLGFGLSFIKTPHIRAKWYINARDKNGPNPQVAAHLDENLRRIYGSFVLQYMNSLDFGFQAIAKRWEERIPAGTYVQTDPNTGEQTEQAIWSQGSVQPLGWKPFIGLPPEFVEPLWAGQGEFNGIQYNTSGANLPAGVGATPIGGSGQGTQLQIDLYHSLWVTNDKDANFGSIYGYPRLGYAYRPWWSYWYRWAVADRAFERKGDPSIVVWFPEGEFVDEGTGATLSYSDYALLMGERIRSGGVIALPSEVYEDANGRGTIRQWDIETGKISVDFEPFDKSFDYLDVAKLRSLWIPEQAFLEGKGGTSSRNVASEMGDSFVESQAVLSKQLIEHINRFIIPQWLALNWADFLANNGTAELVVVGFADQDVEFTKQIVQLIGQQPEGVSDFLKLLDLRRVLQDAGMPINSVAEQQRKQQEIAQAAAANQPPAVTPAPGQTGVVPSSTGFSYIGNYGDTIFLSDNASQFVRNLPSSPHYQDSGIKALAQQMWNLYRDVYRDEIASAIKVIEEADVEAADEEVAEGVELALGENFIRRAASLISKWQQSARWPDALTRTQDIFSRIFKRASQIELKAANLSGQVDEAEMMDWVQTHIADFASKAAETTRTEVRDFIARQMEDGTTDPKLLASEVRKHFDEFPSWKADRLVRTEVRDVYNAATLLSARAAGIDAVQAVDAQLSENTDKGCVDRNGRIFSVASALQEREHPNGTLAWKILPLNLSIERFHPSAATQKIATVDRENNVVYLADTLAEEDERRFLIALVDSIR